MMSILMLMAPKMGMPPMNIGEMLGSMMGGITALGWVAHFMMGLMLSILYALVFARRLPGPYPVRGMLFALLPWLMSQVVVMPMMGSGFFSGSMLAAAGSLMGHLIFGGVLGATYGAGTHSHQH
jgi:uncharacterized membrane protein